MRKSLTALALILTPVLALTACGNGDKTRDGQNTTSAASKVEQQTPVITQGDIDAESARINEWFEARFEEEIAASPIRLTFLGRKEQYDKIDDMSEAAEDARLEWKRQTVEEMARDFDYDKLSDEAKISYDVWKYQYEIAAEGQKFRRNSYVFDQMSGPQSFLPTFLISFHKVESESDMEAYITRISGTGRAMDQLVERARLGVAEGVRPPKFAYEGVLEQAEKVIAGAPFSEGDASSIWADVLSEVKTLQDSGAISETRAEELRLAASQALTNDFGPAYQGLIDFLQSDIENADVIATGVHKLPDGKAYYEYMLKTSTTTSMTPEEVHQLGLSEVVRISKEMETIKEQVGFDGSLQEFFAMIRDSKDDERFYYPDTDEGRQSYIDDATTAIENIKKELPNYFGILPKADLIVKRVESFREQPGAAQHYYPGTPDGERPGTYYAHLSDMKAMPRNQLEVIAYHEGLPGHHMQISIAQESEIIPTFRGQAGFTAYVEGWALYSELLAKEMPNTYQDPYSDFGRLTTEMWRAIRLVVDTGLHEKGWTEQQAIDYFSENSPEPLESVRSEVQRYIVWPGQATSYKIGMIDILRLREKAKTVLGDDFDIKGFHDTVLGGGSLPLEILERRVDNWIETEKG
jgi:uncharacterized protein (DUF885 family)